MPSSQAVLWDAAGRARLLLLCRDWLCLRPLVLACGALFLAGLVIPIFLLSNASVTIQPQYTATLIDTPDFAYNLTDASAEFTLWQYQETRLYTNTSTRTGEQQQLSYGFISSFDSGCSYFATPRWWL